MAYGVYLSAEDLNQLFILYDRDVFLKSDMVTDCDYRFWLSDDDNCYCVLVLEETIRSIGGISSYYGYWMLREHKNHCLDVSSFQNILEVVPEEIQIKLLYHLDFFKRWS